MYFTNTSFLCPLIERSMGAYCFTVVRLSVSTNLTFSHYPSTNLVTRLIFGMKAHLIDTHLLVSRSSANVKVKYQGHVSQKMGILGALVFHKHILFFYVCFWFCCCLFLWLFFLYKMDFDGSIIWCLVWYNASRQCIKPPFARVWCIYVFLACFFLFYLHHFSVV